MNSEIRACQNCKKEFIVEDEDLAFYKKLEVPPPTFCPECRKQRRLSWRNDTMLYSRTCALCHKSVISLYAPNGPINTVYCPKCWWSDKWDPKSYEQTYDPTRTFLEQFAELQRRVPMWTTANDDGITSVNCEYTQDFASSKNCYMVFIAWELEECLYSSYLINGKDIVDAVNSMGDCQFTYETVATEKCFQCRYVYYSVSLSDCSFCYDCRDCADCFMSVGLRHKRYCFKNKQYTKEEYEKILRDYRLDTYTGVEKAKKEFKDIFLSTPRRFATQRNCVNCTGDSLMNCKNSKQCFNVQRGEDCKWVENADTPRGSYDLSVGGKLDQCYEGVTPDLSYRSMFAIFSWRNENVAYVDACHSSKDLFGCVGLKKAQYCILNKQYSKEEYESLVTKIKEDMQANPYLDKNGIAYAFGEFLPSELSYFAYNESVAQDYFPLSGNEVDAKGLRWQDQLQMTVGKETMPLEEIPDGIADVQDEITKEIFACIDCKRNYRVVPAELKFYRRLKIPLPRQCFYCRHKARIATKNPHQLWSCVCDCNRQSQKVGYQNAVMHFHGEKPCPSVFETPFAPDRPEIVYCEQCYQQEVS